VRLFSHILNAHRVWNCRIDARGVQPFGVWDQHSIGDMAAIDQLNFEHSTGILSTHDLDTVLEYANTKGQVFHNSTRDILFHAINHSTYHRGQIAADLKSNGMEPLPTDYIMYKRQ